MQRPDLRPFDPHTIAYLRVLLNTQMWNRFYGAGPRDGLGDTWQRAYPLSESPATIRPRVAESVARMPVVDRAWRSR
jgi:hypothetical protein